MMYMPERVFIHPDALKYETGRRAKAYWENAGVFVTLAKRVQITGETPFEIYRNSKKIVFITLSKEKKLRSCSPSADYQFALSSSCPGFCEYCYLQTTQGSKPYIKIFANIEDIFQVIDAHINKNTSKITTFECSSITDPIPFESITGSLKKCIEFFGKKKNGRLRFVTKYHEIDSLLDAKHNKKTTFRFSINTDKVIQDFEHGTSSMKERVEAAGKVARAGYPIGFIIAPIIIYPEWKTDYEYLLFELSNQLSNELEASFELIQHRYTETAKALIYSRFPKTKLDMNNDTRRLKWGPYGKFKYIYKKEESEEMKTFMYSMIRKYFKKGTIIYFT